MGTATTTVSGHVARALRFFNEAEVFVGIAVTDPWTDENSPPATDIASTNIGRIHTPTYTGSSLNSSNCFATFNQEPFRLGTQQYRITVNTGATTLKLEKLNPTTVISASFAPAPAGNKILVDGLTIFTPSTLTAGDTHTFKVDGPIGYKMVEQKYLVVPDAGGTIDYRGQRWAIVPPNEAYDKGARYVYVMASMRYDELPITDFRQLGVFTGLVRDAGVSGTKSNLLPAEVESTGALELIDNRTVITRNINQKETFSFIIEH